MDGQVSPSPRTIQEVKPDEGKGRLQLLERLKSAQQVKNKRGHRKRRHSVAEDHSSLEAPKPPAPKHRRQYSAYHKRAIAGDIILPTNFLLGGNISDPLNLKSLLDENVNNPLNAVTPSSSPLPPRSSKINIVIPTDMTDPLGLNQGRLANSGLENIPIGITSEGKASAKKKKKRRKSQFDKAEMQSDATMKVDLKPAPKETKAAKNRKSASKLLNIEDDDPPSTARLSVALPKMSIVDPIVSPVVPQDVKRSSLGVSPKSRKRKSASQSKKSTLAAVDGEVSGASVHHEKAKSEGDEAMTEQLLSEIKAARLQSSVKSQVFVPHADHQKSGRPPKSFKPCNARFQYGNYTKYYGYRNPHKFQDDRINFLKKEWFKDKDVLDVGCNVGHFTLLIARDFSPRKVVGIDIDGNLIDCARKNVRHYATAQTRTPASKKYPDSMSRLYGPIIAPPLESTKDDRVSFPNNIVFLQGNYVPEKDDVLRYQEPEYDVIVCLSVTKWVHLNWGDDGLIKTFKRFFKQLRPGGKLILEPQDWKSYTKKKSKLTETIYNNYYAIKLKPESFPRYLVDEIGFKKFELLKSADSRTTKGFQRSIQLYYKPE